MRSIWSCQNHADQPATHFNTTLHGKEWWQGFPHHRTWTLTENTRIHQDQIKTNSVEECPHLLWRTKCLQRHPNHPNRENLDPGTSLPISTQGTVPVDHVKTMVAHVSWGSTDTYHLSHYGIKCLALMTCTCFFVTVALLITGPQNDVVVNLWRILCCWSDTSLSSCLSKDISLTSNTRCIRIKSGTEHAHSVSYLHLLLKKDGLDLLDRDTQSRINKLSHSQMISKS